MNPFLALAPESLIAWSMILPLIGAVLIVVTGRWPNVREAVTLTTATLLFALVLAVAQTYDSGVAITATWLELFPGLPIAFSIEPLGLLFALIASFLWIVTTVYAIGYMRGHHEQNQTRFYLCFAIAIASVMGIAFASNLLTLFIFYEVLTLSTYPLVTHAGTEKAKQGGRVYLGILLSTSIALFLLALLITQHLAGTLDFATGGILAGTAEPFMLGLLLLLYAFGVGKAALMPFHRWLPAAMVAPTPVSALLHAVAVVKAGVFTVIKIAVYIFGIDLLADLAATDLVLYVATATIVLASLIALTKDNLKARLAYSTVSQLGYCVVGAMLATSAGIVGGTMHIANHAFGKITLFFCAGAIMVASHKTEISQMRGLGRTMPFTMAAFLIASLSIIGVPPLAGAWSKWYLLMASLDTGQWLVLIALTISSLLNIAYLLPIPVRAFFSPPAEPGPARIQEAPWPSLVAIAITTFGCLMLFLYPQPLYQLAARIPVLLP